MTDTKNYSSIDVMKFVAVIFVIALHTIPFYEFNSGFALFFRQGITRIAVPFFFVSSGYFFATNLNYNYAHEPMSILIKSLLKLGRLYIAWSLVYIVFDISNLLSKSHGIVSAVTKYLWRFVFIGSHSHLWYIPALMFAMILGYLSHKTKRVEIFLALSIVLYVVGLFGQSYFWVLHEQEFLREVYFNYFSLFETTRNGLFFGFPFVMLGIFIKKTNVSFTYANSLKIRYLSLFWLLFIAEVYLTKNMSGINGYDMYLMLIPLLYWLFVWLLDFKTSIPVHYAKTLREYSMGVYFVHGIFWLGFDWLWAWADIANPHTISFVLVSLCSIITIYLLKRLNIKSINKYIF